MFTLKFIEVCLSSVVYLGPWLGLAEGFGTVLFMQGPHSNDTDKYGWSEPRELLTESLRRPSQRSAFFAYPKTMSRTRGTVKVAMDLTANLILFRRALSSPQKPSEEARSNPRSLIHIARLGSVPVLFTSDYVTEEPDKMASNRTDLELIRQKLRLAIFRSARQPTNGLQKPRVGRKKRLEHEIVPHNVDTSIHYKPDV